MVLQTNRLFWLSDPGGCLKSIFFTANLLRSCLCFWLSWLQFVTSDVRTNIGPNVKFGMVCGKAIAVCLNVSSCWCEQCHCGQLSASINCLRSGDSRKRSEWFFYLCRDFSLTSSCKIVVKTKRFVFSVAALCGRVTLACGIWPCCCGVSCFRQPVTHWVEKKKTFKWNTDI